jgi:hypothetical protein
LRNIVLFLSASLFLFSIGSYANPYCVSGADWRANGVLESLGMPPGSEGFQWGRTHPTILPQNCRPCKTFPEMNCTFNSYHEDTDTIHDATAFQDFILANLGKVYLLGNEPDLTGQDGLAKEQYAAMFHTYYAFVTPLDGTARFAVGALSGDAVAGNVEWDIAWWEDVLDIYRTTYGGQMPVDIWNFHCYIPPEMRVAQDIFDVYIQPFVDWVQTVDGGVYAGCEIWCTEFGVGFWHGPLNAEWVAPIMQRWCLLLEESEVDRWFWFLGPWDSWSGDWQQTCLLDASKNPTVLGTIYSDLANNYPNTTATPMPDPTPAPPPDIFSDDFEDGNDDGWIRKAGDWHVDGGAYRNSYIPPNWWGYFSELPYVYEDFSVEADLKINSAPEDVNWAGVYFRFPEMFGDRGNGGYLVYLRQKGILGLHTREDGTVVTVENAVSDTSVFHRLKVTCTGQPSHILVYLDDELEIDWIDPNGRFASGFVALEAGHTDCSFDNVTVRNLIASDISDTWRFY